MKIIAMLTKRAPFRSTHLNNHKNHAAAHPARRGGWEWTALCQNGTTAATFYYYRENFSMKY